MNTIQSQSSSCVCSLSQAAAVAALAGDQGFVAEARTAYCARRDREVALLNLIPGLSCGTPDGAFYLYPSCAGLIGKTTQDGNVLMTDFDVVMYFLDVAGVALLDGAAYGLSPYLRMSIATSLADIEEGCARIPDRTSYRGGFESSSRLRNPAQQHATNGEYAGECGSIHNQRCLGD